MDIADHLFKCTCGSLWFEKFTSVTLSKKDKEELDTEIIYKCRKCGKVILKKRI